MTTVRQDNQFILAVTKNNLLEVAIAWIANNLEPEDVFPQKRLEDWASAMNWQPPE